MSVFQLAHNSLLAYIRLNFQNYQINWHHQKISQALMAVERGDIDRLIIEAPPRFGKSMMVSEYFIPWYMGRNPMNEVMMATYSQSLANKFGRLVRNQFKTYNYHLTFPGIEISADSKAKHEFSLVQGGEYHAAGVGGGFSGKGASLVILDDTLKGREQAESRAYIDTLHEFFRSQIYTRLTPDGRIVVMQTRWHPEDLIGHVLKEYPQENWTRLTFPAFTDEKETISHWPERFSAEKLHKIKGVQGLYNWNALYMQRPTPREGALFKRVYWKRFDKHTVPPKFDEIIQSWDFTFKDETENDFVVGMIIGRTGLDYYLLDMVRKRMDFLASVQAVLLMCEKWPQAKRIWIEDKANGPGIMVVLKKKIHGIREFDPGKDSKVARANSIIHIVEGGNCYVPNDQWWAEGFIDELACFPKGLNDDQVDAWTQGLICLGGKRDAVAMYEALLGKG